MGKKITWVLGILAVMLLAAPVVGSGQEKTPPAAAPAPPAAAPDARQILLQMCDFLKQQQQFSFKAEITDDRVYAGGRKLQYGLDMEAFFRRPDKMRLNGDGDVEHKQLFFDGKTLILYDKLRNYYGAMEAAGDLDAALDKAGKDHGLHVGLAELGANRITEFATHGLTNALYLGPSKVRGVQCHHLAFDKEHVHYQVWIAAGDKPLLCKLVVTQKKLPAVPQWTAYFSEWNFSPQLADNLFTFSPPEGAYKVKFNPAAKIEPPAKDAKPQKKKKGGAA
jgi:hypothetical protein